MSRESEKRKVNAFTFVEYSEVAKKTAIYPYLEMQEFPELNGGPMRRVPIVYTTLGLCSEAGEIAGKLKKVIRDENGNISEKIRRSLVSECGDALWYLALILEELNSSLAYAAKENNLKLLDRQKRGVIQGSGDER